MDPVTLPNYSDVGLSPWSLAGKEFENRLTGNFIGPYCMRKTRLCMEECPFQWSIYPPVNVSANVLRCYHCHAPVLKADHKPL